MITGQRSKRTTLLNLSSFQILTMFRRGLFYSYLSIYLRFFLGLSVTETTLFATLPMVLNVVFQRFVWGALSDKYQKRRTYIIMGEVLAAVGTLLVWYLHKLPESRSTAGYIIIIGLSVVEIFWSMSNIGWSAIISDLYPEGERTGVQGKLSSLGAIGRIVGVLIGGLAYDGLARYYEGWGFDNGFLFFVASGIMLVSTIPMFFVPEGGVSAGQPQSSSTHTHARTLSRVFAVFMLAMIFINFGRNSIAIIKAQYLSLDTGFNVSSQVLSYIVNMESLAIFIVGLFISRLSKSYKDATLLFAGATVAIFSLVGFALASTLPLIYVCNFLLGVSMVIILSASYSYASQLIPPDRRGKQFAWFNATFFLSWGMAATIVSGPIVDLLIRSGASEVFAYRMSFFASALLVVIGLLILFLADRMRRHAIEDRPQS
ncbi:MAG: MFS transporter [candidate division WOR-3 bacterium]|nr:MFS transporter [candidate division WOR-3 bacterium]